MHVVVRRESYPGEHRVAVVPSRVRSLLQWGVQVSVENDLGLRAGYDNNAYTDAGAQIVSDSRTLLQSADVVLGVRQPKYDLVEHLKEGAVHISFWDPVRDANLIPAFVERSITSISMELIPRTTRAQRMDALSSQSNLAGYVATTIGANHLPRVFPMMMTAAGTLPPAKVFVIGAGVAGLQAIATARRLGARVEAFDTRPVVAEEVRSLGAKFVELDLGETGQTQQGYAKALTAAQLQLQQQGIAKIIAQADVVITTAQVFGRPAPRIVTRAMVAAMRPGSVVIDMAIENGGNVEGSVLDQVMLIDGVQVIGFGNLPSKVASHASALYASNLIHLLEEFHIPNTANFHFDLDNEIARACVVTSSGKVLKEFHT